MASHDRKLESIYFAPTLAHPKVEHLRHGVGLPRLAGRKDELDLRARAAKELISKLLWQAQPPPPSLP